MSQPEEPTPNPNPNPDPSQSTDHTPTWTTEGTAARDLTGRILGDYKIERLLGRGGMGEVYLASQLSLNRPVALKLLRPELLSKPAYLSRFEAEATAVAKLNHPNIVHIYALGQVDGIRFIAMEYVKGTNLKEYLRVKHQVDLPHALSFMKQALQAVNAAGKVGLLHRDLKPENLLLTKTGQLKVADFGLCRDLDNAPTDLTQSGVTLGTPAYMSPEQAQGHSLDHRSDLYSLGVTFYHMLAGVPPFRAETALALALKQVRDSPASILVHRPDLPPALDALVLKLIEKDPARRFQSAGEALRELSIAREALNAPSGLQSVADVVGSSTTTHALPTSSIGKIGPQSRPKDLTSAMATLGSRWGRRAGVALAVLALGLGLLSGWLSRPKDLLSSSVPPPTAPPGLWIAPGWTSMPRAETAEAQYQEALIRSTQATREEAWLAVPGFWPDSREWASLAYTQLARELLRRHDADRLDSLASEIEHWDKAQTQEVHLSALCRAAAQAVVGDVDGVIETLNTRLHVETLTNPALLELTLAVTSVADQVARRPNATATMTLAREALSKLRQDVTYRLLQAEVGREPLTRRSRSLNGFGKGAIVPRNSG